MAKSKLTEAAVLTAQEAGIIGAEAIAKHIGYGGKTGVVSKQTLDKIDSIIAGFKPAKKPAKKKATKKTIVKAVAPKEEPPLTVKQVKSANPFGNSVGLNSLHHVLFAANSKRETPFNQAVTNGVLLTGRNPDTVRSFLRTLSNPADKHNGCKSVNIATEGNIRLAAVA